MSDYSIFYEYWSLHTELWDLKDNTSIYNEFPDVSRSTLRTWKKKALQQQNNNQKQNAPSSLRSGKSQSVVEREVHTNNNGQKGSPPPAPDRPFIDDPDELLYSVAIRELNKTQPDPRWANILLSCREKIQKSKLERQSALLNKPTTKLLHMIEKSYGKPLAKDSSPILNSSEE